MCVFCFFLFLAEICAGDRYFRLYWVCDVGTAIALGGVEWSGRHFRDIGQQYMSYMSIASHPL